MPTAPPQYLYKYRAVDANALALLASDRLYLSRVDAFNDPFEFLNLDASLESSLDENGKGEAEEAEGKHREETFRTALRVCSLTEESRDLLMWGHYGDRHRGFCIRFEFAHDQEIAKLLFPVKYRPTLPELAEPPQSPFDMVRGGALAKSDKWSYEREWRIITSVPEEEAKTAELLLPYNPRAISGIVFGVRTPPLHKKLIRKLLADHGHVEFFEASRRHDQFALEICEAES